MAVGRSDILHELVLLLESESKDTILGSDINIVRHLFYYLKADNREFEFIYEEKIYMAEVKEIVNGSVLLNIPDFVDEGIRRAVIRFEIMNVLYQFDLIIQDIRESIIKIKIPTELQSVQLRQNKRIPVDDLFMSFIILFRSLAGGTREVGKNIYAESRFSHLMREIRKDKPNLKLIIIMLNDYIRKVSNDYDIIIFKKNEKLSAIETMVRNILSSENKSLYIKDTTNLVNYYEYFEDNFLCNFHSEYNKLSIALSEEEIKEYFEGVQKKEIREFLISYVYSPIKIYDEVVGYIKVYTTAMDKYSITQSQATYIHELSEIINYAITKVAIQISSYSEYKHSTKIIDISMTGLLFEIHNQKLFNYLKRHNVIKMNIPLPSGKTLVIRGVIVRYQEAEDRFLLGVNFFDSNPDDMLYLSNYLYEKSTLVLYG